MKKIELSLMKTHGNKENHCPERDGLGRGWRVWSRLWSITQVCITHGQAREEFALHVTACSYVFILWKVQKSTRIDGKIDTIRTVPDVRHNNAIYLHPLNNTRVFWLRALLPVGIFWTGMVCSVVLVQCMVFDHYVEVLLTWPVWSSIPTLIAIQRMWTEY